MLMSYNKMKPDKSWIHRSDLKNVNGDTVAMIWAYNEIIAPIEWYHKADIKNRQEKTVYNIL